MSGFLGSGNIEIARYVAGVLGGFVPAGNATQFEIKENAKIVNRESRMKGSYGSALDTVGVKSPADFNMTLDDGSRDNLALALMGDASAYSQSSATNQSANVTLSQTAWAALPMENVSDVAITGKVLGTDFEVNATLGLIRALTVGTVGAQTVTFSAGAIAGDLVQGGANSIIQVAIKFDGINLANGLPVIIDIWKAVLIPAGGVDFLSDKFSEMKFSGSLIVPAGKTSAYQIRQNLALS